MVGLKAKICNRTAPLFSSFLCLKVIDEVDRSISPLQFETHQLGPECRQEATRNSSRMNQALSSGCMQGTTNFVNPKRNARSGFETPAESCSTMARGYDDGRTAVDDFARVANGRLSQAAAASCVIANP